MESKHVSLKDYTSIRIGGEGKMITVKSVDELKEVVMEAKAEGFRLHLLGGGTNTFFGETLPEDLLIIKNELKGISFEEKGDGVLCTASAGEIWDDLVSSAISKEYWGIENLSYIPGTVGAAPVQNIGAYGVEIKDVLISLDVFDTVSSTIISMSTNDCQFGYRDSIFKKQPGRYIILSITLKLSKNKNLILTYKPLDSLVGKDVSIQEVRDLVIKTRIEKLPDYQRYPNAGSFFKNPVVSSAQSEALRAKYPNIPLHETADGYKVPAAWLIEHIGGMKGVKEGSLGTWPNQSLVMVNYGEATGEELLHFSQKIIDIVQEKTGIILEREVNYIQ